MGVFFAVMKMFWNGTEVWLYLTVKVPNATESFTSKLLMVCCVNFTAFKTRHKVRNAEIQRINPGSGTSNE